MSLNPPSLKIVGNDWFSTLENVPYNGWKKLEKEIKPINKRLLDSSVRSSITQKSILNSLSK